MGSDNIKKNARVTANLSQLRKIFGVTCAYSGCRGNCEELAGDYGEEYFDTCPVRSINTKRWKVILDLFSASKVSPLCDWPYGYVPWVVTALTDLNNEIEAVITKAQQEALNGSR